MSRYFIQGTSCREVNGICGANVWPGSSVSMPCSISVHTKIQLTFSSLKQVILNKSRQNGYQKVCNLKFVSFWSECSEKSLSSYSYDFATYMDGQLYLTLPETSKYLVTVPYKYQSLVTHQRLYP